MKQKAKQFTAEKNSRDYRGKSAVLFFDLCICGCVSYDHIEKGVGECLRCKDNKFITCKKFRPRHLNLEISFRNLPRE
jgi:hypothetical protein